MSTSKTSLYDAIGCKLQQLSAGITVLRLAIESGDLEDVLSVSHLYALEDACEALRDDFIALDKVVVSTDAEDRT